MNDPVITLRMIKQVDGGYRIRTETENGWAKTKGLVCTAFQETSDGRIVIILEPRIRADVAETASGHA